jgi:hypothetical protein
MKVVITDAAYADLLHIGRTIKSDNPPARNPLSPSCRGATSPQLHGSIALLRISAAASGEAMNFRNALATSGSFATVSTPPANLTVSCSSFGSGPM